MNSPPVFKVLINVFIASSFTEYAFVIHIPYIITRVGMNNRSKTGSAVAETTTPLFYGLVHRFRPVDKLISGRCTKGNDDKKV